MSDPLIVEHDKKNDVLTVNGIAYSGHLFRAPQLSDVGSWLLIEERSNGTVTVFEPSPEHRYKFDAMTGKA